MLTCLIYCRVSSRSQEDNSSLESQAAACRAYAEENGYEVIREVKEIYSGATLLSRPLLNECRDEIRAGRANALIVYDIDRLSRDIVHFIVLLDECKRFNAQILFVLKDFEDTPDGKLFLMLRSYIAEVERLTTIERTTRGRKAKANSGELSYKRKLFGYDLNAEGKRVINKPQAKTVRRIFKSFLGGKSLRQIAVDLNSEGIKTSMGKLWQAQTVHVVLSNPAYSGRTFVFRESEVFRYVEGERRRRRVRQSLENHVELFGVTPAIVSEKDFELVQKQLIINRKQKRGLARKEFLLRGLVKCAKCGRSYSPHAGNTSRRYVCTSSQSSHINCRTRTLNAEKAESLVWAEAVRIIKKPERLSRIIDKRLSRAGGESRSRASILSGKITQSEKELRNLISRMAELDDKMWKIVKGNIESKQAEIDNLKLELKSIDTGKDEIDVAAVRERLAEIDLNELSFAGKADCLKLLQTRITFDGKNLDIRFMEV